MSYAERRERLLIALGQPQNMPFYGISPVEEQHHKDRGERDDYLSRVQRKGARGLLARDPGGLYLPGDLAERDFIFQAGRK